MSVLESAAEFRQNTQYKRLLGLDIGEKTIGLALSDATQTIATPLLIIQRKKFMQDAEQLLAIVKEHAIGGLIIGLPLHMDGGEGKKCQSVRQFARNLLKIQDLPVMFQDERLSTVAVTRTMLEADLSREKRKTHVDKMAASYILQGFLDQLAYTNQ